MLHASLSCFPPQLHLIDLYCSYVLFLNFVMIDYLLTCTGHQILKNCI